MTLALTEDRNNEQVTRWHVRFPEDNLRGSSIALQGQQQLIEVE